MTSPLDALYLEPSEKKQPHVIQIKLVDQSGHYKIGPATRPNIKQDNGFLDKFKPRPPNAIDRLQLAKWKALLEGSEALCTARSGRVIPQCYEEDLTDANAAYRHFLYGNGAERTIDYERFLRDDESGKTVMPKLIADFKKQISVIGKDRIRFSVTSTQFSVGDKGIARYPESVNWQRTLGAHYLWVSADVTASCSEGRIVYVADLVVHMEDRYNFVPGSHDIATGTPDSDNGRFEITGLAHQYMNYGTIIRHIRWTEELRVSH